MVVHGECFLENSVGKVIFLVEKVSDKVDDNIVNIKNKYLNNVYQDEKDAPFFTRESFTEVVSEIRNIIHKSGLDLPLSRI